MKLSDYIINFLVANKVTHIYEVCGGSITHLLDSLYERKDISVVSLHHEQAAAFAAEGHSRASKGIGVAMATSGPGATNLITAIASCYFDSIPGVFITGQVNTYEFKFTKPVRQVGFQETDIVNIVRPITKYAVMVTDPKKIRYYLEKAFYLAQSGRPGPVLIDLPMDIQRAEIKVSELCQFKRKPKALTLDKNRIKTIVGQIKDSERPVFLIGGGLRLSSAVTEFEAIINRTEIPVVSSLLGIDGFQHDHPAYSGMIGAYGHRFANLAIANADLVIVLGSRLDTRQTGTMPKTFARGAKIIQVDIDPQELKNNRRKQIGINGQIKDFLLFLEDQLGGYDKTKIRPWRETITKYEERYPANDLLIDDKIGPGYFMKELSRYLPNNAIICADVGQNQMWAAQSLVIKKGQRFITQGGAGAMGSSLAMGIGAAFSNPGKTVVVISGDGGFQLNLQELQTVFHYDLPLKIILLNNHCYGMVKQFQEQYFNSRFQSTLIGYSCPDFQRVVSAYKIASKKIKYHKEVGQALTNIFKNNHPEFLEIEIDPDCKVLPKLSVNRPIEDQEPLLPRKELKSNMLIDLWSEE